MCMQAVTHNKRLRTDTHQRVSRSRASSSGIRQVKTQQLSQRAINVLLVTVQCPPDTLSIQQRNTESKGPGLRALYLAMLKVFAMLALLDAAVSSQPPPY